MKLLFGIKAMDVAGGGAEKVLSVVASGLAGRGHDVVVMSFDLPGGNSFYPLDTSVRRICLGMGPTESPTGAWDFLRRLPALHRVAREEQPDVAVGFMHSMFVPLSLVAAALQVPMVASEHIVPDHYRGKKLQFALFVAGCLLSTRVTVLSEQIRSTYPRFLQKRMSPVPNPVGYFERHPAVRGGEDGQKKTVLSVGRLEQQKDHATLIRAFAKVSGRYPDWKLRIVGEGTLRKSLEELVQTLGLQKSVELPGASAHVEREYATAGIVAVPSRYESFGLATAEAMSAGLPVIGFDNCPGTRELIRHEANGLLVDGVSGNRVDALATGLITLMGDAELRRRLGDSGKQSLPEFTPERVADRWESLLIEVVAGRSHHKIGT
jgi:glycosyltransferase involved in cell wall biosynthesis